MTMQEARTDLGLHEETAPMTVAFCTYNRAERLPNLVAALRAQACTVPFAILAIDNNSSDATPATLARLAQGPGPPLRFVTERVQGIVSARNRAVAEARASEIMLFIDDDELPCPGLLAAAYDAIAREGAEVAGGRVVVNFGDHVRPSWLDDDLLGFLAAVDYGDRPFWITDTDTPVWTANVAYDMRLFRDDPGLRFDKRFDRVGNAIGGGEDAIMFRELLARRCRIRYRPDMAVDHFVEPWRLTRRYFLQLHYRGGVRKGNFTEVVYPRSICGVPPFLVAQAFAMASRAIAPFATGAPGGVRNAMNAVHTFGMIAGLNRRWRNVRRDARGDASRATRTNRID